MKGYLVVIPGSPALVRELAPADEAGGRLLFCAREVIGGLLAAAPDRAIELVGSRAPRWRTEREGSFGAWGAPGVTMGEGHYLPELVQRYVLGEEGRRVTSSRGSIGKINPEALTVVAVDGSAGLTARAPLALVDGAADADAWCRAVLSGAPTAEPHGDNVAPWLSERGVIEPDLWAELASLAPARAELAIADTALGVGRYVAEWEM